MRAAPEKKVEVLIGERLLAKEAAKCSLSLQALLDIEGTSKVGLVTEQETETYHKANKARLQGEGDEAAVREQIRAQLQRQKLDAQRDVFLQSLRSDANVVVHLTAPPIARIEVPIDGAIAMGPATAPVTIVEFTDFHCPFCNRVRPTLAELKFRFGEELRHVHRDFPLDRLPPQARRAHEAARCANDQGKFWAYRDIVYAHAPNASAEDLKTYAREVGLDKALEHCLSDEATKAVVQKDVEEGRIPPTAIKLAPASSLRSALRAGNSVHRQRQRTPTGTHQARLPSCSVGTIPYSLKGHQTCPKIRE